MSIKFSTENGNIVTIVHIGAEGGDDFLLRAGLFVHTVGYDTRNKP